MDTDREKGMKSFPAALQGAAGILFAILAYFLWTEHRAHLMGALPYLLLLLCPFIHLFMHRGHHGDGGHHHEHGREGRDV